MATPQRLKVTLPDLLHAQPNTAALNSPRSKEICKRHGILADELYPRELHSFVEQKHEPAEIVQRRYEHFNTRRMEKLQFLIGEYARLLETAAAAAAAAAAGVHHTPEAAAAAAGAPPAAHHGYAASPEGGAGAGGYEHSFDVEARRLEGRIRKEEERAALRDHRARMIEDERAHKSAKLQYLEERHQNALAAAEEQRTAEAVAEAEK
eukprot:Rhum_TRINITY_DN14326_c30_g1::Rhum_TRINITY_DN14326_c30_g1_i1::g.85130::m.85130